MMSANLVQSHAMQPAAAGFIHRRVVADREFQIDVMFDGESGMWLARCAEIGLYTEAATIDALEERALLIAPEIAVENGKLRAGESVAFTFAEQALA